MNHSQIKSILLKSLEGAGKILLASINKPKQIEKKSELSLVTATDKAAERFILKTIRKAFPGHSFLCEESGASGTGSITKKGADPQACRWIIDPLDGTTNYAHSYPIATVSIAYEEDGVVQMGGVFDPFRGELFLAEKGKGAALNGKKIHVSKVTSLRESLVCTGFPYDRRENPEFYLGIIKEFLMRTHDLRRSGSAALDLAYVACGRLDGYWEFKLQPWDKAAGALIVTEAGGKITDMRGGPHSLTGIQNLATNGCIHNEMLAVFKKIPKLIDQW